MGTIEQSPETHGARPVPSYVLIAEYVAAHIGEPALTVNFLMERFQLPKQRVFFYLLELPSIETKGGLLCLSNFADMTSLQEEVEMAHRKVGRRNHTQTAVRRQTPSHLPAASNAHRRR
jgi:hypothetical protein